MSTGPVAKRRRTGKPKAKTGCLTCKIRRVKCDEARPECLRCQKFGTGFCDGYQPDRIHPSQTSNKVIQSNSRLLAPYPVQPTLQKFQNDDELRSFRLYCDEVAPGLSFSTSIWKHLLLQAGQDQQFIQHGIIAIGGLYKSLQIMGTNTIRVPGTHKLPPSLFGEQPPRDSTHARVHEFALQHYGVFLRGVKEHMALAKPERGLRTALIACLLVYCVENMQLHHREAIMHAQNGLRLMAEFLNKRSKPRDPLNSTSSAPQNVFVEDEIVQQFQRLDLQILAVSDLRTTNDHLKTDGPIDVKTMPPTFKTIEDAKTYLELITRRSFYFVAQAFTTSRFLTYLEPTEEVLTESSPGSTANYSRSIKGLTTTDQSPGNGHSISSEIPSSCLSRLIISTPPSTQVQQEIYASENRRWQHAFEPLFQSAMREISQPESLQALLLMVQSTSLAVRLAGHLSPTELIYDQFLPEFGRIVRWSRMILDHPCSDTFFSPGSFILDMGLIYHVLTVAMYCRDRKLKRQAIAILKQKPWREAQWGSDSAADVATYAYSKLSSARFKERCWTEIVANINGHYSFIMEIEEEGIETEYIPESARARMCGVEINASARTVRLHCLQGPRESVIHRESERDWSMTGG